MVPGNLSEKLCNQYKHFRDYGRCNTRTVKGQSSIGIMKGDMSTVSISNAMNQMRLAGLIEDQKAIGGIYGAYGFSDDPTYKQSTKGLKEIIISGTTSGGYGVGSHYFPFSSYDKSVYIQPMGWHIDKWAEHGGYKNFSDYTFCGSNTIVNSGLPHEFQNTIYLNALNNKNTFTLLRQPILKSSTATSTVNMPNQGALSAKMASELDAKLDDGRPGTGRILAMKAGSAHDKGVSMDTHNAVCYDKRADEVDKAIYQSSTNLKFGCNVTYVMEKLK